MQTHQPFEKRHAYEYIRYSIQHKEVDQARAGLAADLPPVLVLLPICRRPTNLIVNGNFNLEMLNAGFDWQYQKQSGVNLTLDPRRPSCGPSLT